MMGGLALLWKVQEKAVRTCVPCSIPRVVTDFFRWWWAYCRSVTDIGVWKSQVWLPSQVATLEGHLDYCLVMSWRNCMWFYRPVSLVSNTVYRWSFQCCPDLYFFLSVVMPETRRETKLMLIEISICGRDLAHSPVVSFSLHNNPAR